MGCHTWTYKTRKDMEDCNIGTAPHEFMFRVFDYQEDVLTSYEQAEKFVLDTLQQSTNYLPKIEGGEGLTYAEQMKGKILLASENGQKQFKDPTLTLKRLKKFFEKYPEGCIDFG